MPKSPKPRVIPEQDSRILGTICVCQLTLVLSAVALVYLSVAVYAPSHKTFTSGFETTPVMCDTVNTTIVNNCPWASCAEWCLSRPSGYCSQIYVNVRRHGSNLTLTGCSRARPVSCPQANLDVLSRINCTKPRECVRMRGLFTCKAGLCANISEVLQCTNVGEGKPFDVAKGRMENMNGNFQCRGSKCNKFKKQLQCDHICPKVVTGTNNVFLAVGSTIVGARCTGAVATDPNAPWPAPAPLWSPSDGTLLASCYTFEESTDTINASDCVNGTVIQPGLLPHHFMNFTQFKQIWRDTIENDFYKQPRPNIVPRGGALLPPSHMLFLNEGTSMLYINLDRCVNTLRGECKEFMDNYGSDGSNNTARSRFPCYYDKGNFSVVLARFDLKQAWRDLIIATLVPSILLVVSLTTLCVITRSVKVGDDAKLRCLSRCCAEPTRDAHEAAEPT